MSHRYAPVLYIYAQIVRFRDTARISKRATAWVKDSISLAVFIWHSNARHESGHAGADPLNHVGSCCTIKCQVKEKIRFGINVCISKLMNISSWLLKSRIENLKQTTTFNSDFRNVKLRRMRKRFECKIKKLDKEKDNEINNLARWKVDMTLQP